jgi:hypothetical protein
MAPKAEYFATDGSLEPTGERKGEDHHRHADTGCNHGQPDDKPGEGNIFVEGNAPGYEGCEVQYGGFRQKYGIMVLRYYGNGY